MPVIVVAAIGIVVNLGAAWFVRDGPANDLNRRGAFLHLVADAAVSLVPVLARVGMLTPAWTWPDLAPALSEGLVVAAGSFALTRHCFHATIDAVPHTVDEAAEQAFLRPHRGGR